MRWRWCVTGGLAHQVGNLIGIGSSAVTVWDIAKWPVLLLVVSLMFSISVLGRSEREAPRLSLDQLRAACSPSSCGWSHPDCSRFTWPTSPPTTRPTALWRSVIIFLVWLWISNVAILLDAELNAELERERHIIAGHPADEEPYVELRDSPDQRSS